MAKHSFTFTGFERYKKAIDPRRFNANLQRNMGVAMGQAAHFVQRRIRQEIKKGIKPKNADLTIAIKKSSKPLVDKGDLWNAITTQQPAWNRAFVGVLRSDPAANIAEILHEGANVPVSRKMRALFYVLWIASQRRKQGKPISLTGRAGELFERYQDWKPLSSDTRMIKIPARRFIAIVFEDPGTKSKVRVIWSRAILKTFREAAKR